jgi:hypothetical protein
LFWLVLCHVCNFLDAVMTLRAVNQGAKELNPIMAWTLEQSPGFFLFIKFLLFSYAIDFIAKRSPKLLILVGVVFLSVVAWHVHILF